MVRKKRIPTGLIILIIIGAIGIGIYFINRSPTKETSQKEVPEETTFPLAGEELPEEKLEGEIIDQVIADLKKTGQLQLITLNSVKKNSHEFSLMLRIYTDSSGQTLEWEGSPIESTLGLGNLAVLDNPATERTTIQVIWGAGAHGSDSQFIHWTDSGFEMIKAVDENNNLIPAGAFFSDAGGATMMPDGTISVALRNYSCPLLPESAITFTYKWNGIAYQLIETKTPECPSE